MRPRWTFAVILVAPALLGFTWPGTVEWLCTRGVKQYRARQYQEAGESFSRALQHSPENATLQYNRGTALYHQQRFEEAEEALSAAAGAAGEELSQDAHYNLGNARFAAGDLEGAIEAYKQALRLDPSDGEAKWNLELAQQRLDEQQQQQQQDQQQEEQKKDEESEQEQQEQEEREEESQQQDQGEEQQPDEDQGDQQQAEEAEQDQAEPEQQDHAQPQPAEEGELTEEQARRLLRALASEDAEMQRIIRRTPRRREPQEGEKDW